MKIENIKKILNSFEKTADELKGVLIDKEASEKTRTAAALFIDLEIKKARNFILDTICSEEAENK